MSGIYPNEIIETMVGETKFYDNIDPNMFDIDAELGFLSVLDTGAHIGFGIMPDGVTQLYPPQRTADTRFMDYPKGVGFRVTNIATAMIPPRRKGPRPAIRAIEIDGLSSDFILDVRRQGTVQHLGGIARHASLLVQSKLKGDAQALDRVERSYRSSVAVHMNVPPSWLDEQKYIDRIEHPVEPSMLLIRGRNVRIRRIGDVVLAKRH
ncbi:MAG: hypothetical protein ACQR33_03975 [Candidatus Saccharibacteria bacterium]